MPKPRTPIPVADVTGYSSRHPERFRNSMRSVLDDPVGEPPEWLTTPAQDAWREFASTLPWLNRSHRGHLAITSLLAGRLCSGAATDSSLNLLRLCLGQLGATPADFVKVGWAPPEDEDDDLDD
jgi:hypothetical protein